MVQYVASSNPEISTELPEPRANFRTAFEALPIKVIARHIAEERILRICPKIGADALSSLHISQIERIYRRRMNARKADSGTKTYVVATPEEIPSRLAELKLMFAALTFGKEIPDQRIDLDASREFAEASA